MTSLPVAIFVDRFIPGGTQRQLIELLRRIDRQRFRVHPVCFHDDGPWTDRVAELGDAITSFPIHGFRRPGTGRQLLRFARWCRRNRIAVLFQWAYSYFSNRRSARIITHQPHEVEED